MGAADMLDVIHYLFEEDVNHASGEQAEAQSAVRRNLYSTMYKTRYKYGLKPTSRASETYGGDAYYDDDVSADLGSAAEFDHKPYVPPTNFDPDAPNPFQGVLREVPLG
jgi:hypothetical protein